MATGFVLYVDGTQSSAAPLVVKADETLFQFWEVVLAAYDVHEVNVAVTVKSSDSRYAVVSSFRLFERRVYRND